MDANNSSDEDEQPQMPALGRVLRRAPGKVRVAAVEGEVNQSDESWLRTAHRLGRLTMLDVDDPRAPDPPNFRDKRAAPGATGPALRPPQATILHALLELTARPMLRLQSVSQWEAGCEPILCPHTIVISEKPSFGKTVLALARECAIRATPKFPLPVSLLSMSTGAQSNHARVAVGHLGERSVSSQYYLAPQGRGFQPLVTCRYGRYLPTTFVVASASVISQWEENTERFTDLKFFTIDSVRTLRAYQAAYQCGEATVYDMVFVKIGKVSTSFQMPGEPGESHQAVRSTRPMLQALRAVLEGVIVTTVIYDDADVAQFACDECRLPAFSSIIISATRRETSVSTRLPDAPTVQEFFRQADRNQPIMGAMLDDVLFTTQNLRCNPHYTDQYMSTTRVSYRRILVEGGQAARILADLDVAAEVLEMVDAGAAGAAARRLGIEAASPADLIARVLADRLEKYQGALRLKARLRAFRTRAPHDGTKDITEKTLDVLKEGTDAEFERLLATVRTSLSSSTRVATWERNNEDVLSRCGLALTRMRDNIRERRCLKCHVPFNKRGGEAEGEDEDEDELDAMMAAAGVAAPAAAEQNAAPTDAYILGCCQVVLCEPCVLIQRGANTRYLQKCPNCARPLNPLHMVRVGGDVSLEDALTDQTLIDDKAQKDQARAAEEKKSLSGAEEQKGDDGHADDDLDDDAEDGAAPPLRALAADVDPVVVIQRLENLLHGDDAMKMRALVQLVLGLPVDCIADTPDAPPFIRGLLEGSADRPHPEAHPHKYLIFSVYPESTRKMAASFEALGLPHVVLRGSRATKDAGKEAFRTWCPIMIVTAARDCAGMHLPHATRVVLYHSVGDPSLLTQLGGRAQRLGREYNLEIIGLYFNHEEERERQAGRA
jgi:hypothetical protein